MVKPGQNLLALDLMRIKRDLETHPPIASVAVERILPDTLRLFISERQPVAQTIALSPRRGGGLDRVPYEFDGDGFVMRPLDPAWRMTPAPTNETLPMLTGVPPVELQPGRQVELSQIRAALRLQRRQRDGVGTGIVVQAAIPLRVQSAAFVNRRRRQVGTTGDGASETRLRDGKCECHKKQGSLQMYTPGNGRETVLTMDPRRQGVKGDVAK